MADTDLQLANSNDETVQRIQRKSLAQQVADELRDLILLEKLSPGAPIPERETAAALGVSRTPLRESLRILASEGLVEIAPNRAPRVADPSLDELRDLLQVQGALESLAGELACENASDAQIKAIREQQRDMQKTSGKSEPLAFFQRDMAFHRAIVAASRNRVLIEAHTTNNARLWRARFISSRQQVNRPATLDQHERIAMALLQRDRVETAAALREHLEVGFTNICTARANAENEETS